MHTLLFFSLFIQKRHMAQKVALLLRGDRRKEEVEVLAEDLLAERTGDLLLIFLRP